jgi:retron-type reverse transcriptase
MECRDIRELALAMRDVRDLRLLLNRAKRSALGAKAYPIHLRQITYYADPRREDVLRYRNFPIPKKSGGERLISLPVDGLKSILRALNSVLQALYQPTAYAMGFVQGRSVVDNARVHLGQNYIYNIDLKDFFTSIDKSRVWRRLTLPPYNLPSQLADIVAGLCTMRLEDGDKVRYVLPQGAPTSPTLTNIICEKLDRQLAGLARKFGLRYTRYADDITFSSMHYVYSFDGEFVTSLRQIIEQNHFVINETKSRLQCRGERQEVTGIVLSDRLNVARQYTRELRTLLHVWQRYGYLAARESYLNHHAEGAKCRFYIRDTRLESSIMGKLQYLRMVKGETDALYMRLKQRFDELMKEKGSAVKYAKYGEFSYLYTVDVPLFESTFNTRICYNAESDVKLYFVDGGVIKPIALSSRLDAGKLFASDNDENRWHGLQISLCESHSTQFYMLHRRLVNPLFSKPRHKKRSSPMDEYVELFNSNANSALIDEFFFRNYGRRMTIDDLGDVVAQSDESGAISELAHMLDADITVLASK